MCPGTWTDPDQPDPDQADQPLHTRRDSRVICPFTRARARAPERQRGIPTVHTPPSPRGLPGNYTDYDRHVHRGAPRTTMLTVAHRLALISTVARSLRPHYRSQPTGDTTRPEATESQLLPFRPSRCPHAGLVAGPLLDSSGSWLCVGRSARTRRPGDTDSLGVTSVELGPATHANGSAHTTNVDVDWPCSPLWAGSMRLGSWDHSRCNRHVSALPNSRVPLFIIGSRLSISSRTTHH
jgi:hypothetical protein